MKGNLSMNLNLCVEIQGATPEELLANARLTVTQLEAALLKTNEKQNAKAPKKDKPASPSKKAKPVQEEQTEFDDEFINDDSEGDEDFEDEESDETEDDDEDDVAAELSLEDDIIPACKKNKEKARKLLKKFKVDTARKLKKSDYAAFLKGLK